MRAETRQVWLVINRSSGSNDRASADNLRARFGAIGWTLGRSLCFPDDGVPTVEELRAAGDPVVAIFTGDGTVNTFASALEDWDGTVLVLPGGTQNLVSQRLHGDAEADVIIDRIARGAARGVRITAIRCAEGQALADLLVGPGASWQTVREAMREGELAAIAENTGEALSRTKDGPGVRCVDPLLGSPDGYPLVKLMPTHRGIQVDAYHADNLAEFLAQGWAMLRRDFRAGPHDRLGLVDRLAMDKADASPVDILLDGEAGQLGARAEFWLAECKINLLATDHGY